MGHTQSDIALKLGQRVFKDKFGKPLEVGDSVEVDSTEDNFDFLGTIDSFKDDYVVVEDMDGDCFCMKESEVALESNDDDVIIAMGR